MKHAQSRASALVAIVVYPVPREYKSPLAELGKRREEMKKRFAQTAPSYLTMLVSRAC
jgi:hypothetical protein